MTDKSTSSGATAAIILAAGQGKRMRSKLPKVLHPIAGTPMVAHVVKLALARKCTPIVVVIDPQGLRVREALTARFPNADLRFATQEKQLGTGDATRVGLEAIPEHSGGVLLLYGDVPLLTAKTVGRLERAARGKDMSMLSTTSEDPTGYGRVLREGKRVVGIVEHRDATTEQKKIDEVNVGVYVFDSTTVREALGKLSSDNSQGEFYLTDIVAQASDAVGVGIVCTPDSTEVFGVNDRMQLAEAEVFCRHRLVVAHMERGVHFKDPNCTFVDADVRIERDVVLGIGVQLYGRTRIGAGAIIEGPVVIKDCDIGPGAEVHAFSHLERAKVGRGASVGPFARLRPAAQLDAEARVGNFVEIKKARIGKGAKAGHLAYIGDADIGPGSNIGAGTITCNYDGASKHQTTIGAGTFVGSNSTLVAPVTLGKGSYIAAGSTVGRDVPPDALAFGRSRQVNKDDYAKHMRKKQAEAKEAAAGAEPTKAPRRRSKVSAKAADVAAGTGEAAVTDSVDAAVVGEDAAAVPKKKAKRRSSRRRRPVKRATPEKGIS